jgi:phage terminase small subunit
MSSLTAKQAKFVTEYLVDLNATQAAIRAGYSEKTAGAIGQENLRKPTIYAAVTELRAAQATDTKIDANMVLEGLLAETVGGQQSGRIAAWGWIGKHLAMFTDKVQHGGDPPQINISVRPEGEPVGKVHTNGGKP